MISLQVNEKHLCGGFLASWKIGISTGFCINYIRRKTGLFFRNATIFYGAIHLDIKSDKHRKNIHHANSHPEYNPQNPNQYQSFDIGYVLVSLMN